MTFPISRTQYEHAIDFILTDLDDIRYYAEQITDPVAKSSILNDVEKIEENLRTIQRYVESLENKLDKIEFALRED